MFSSDISLEFTRCAGLRWFRPSASPAVTWDWPSLVPKFCGCKDETRHCGQRVCLCGISGHRSATNTGSWYLSSAPGIEPGHIPGAANIPFTEFLTEEGLVKSPEEIRHLFQQKKVDLSQPLVATCGSGISACTVVLGAYLCGKPDVPVYDGSWVEWYMRAQPENIISEGRGKMH